jgi:PST family polysaccharide transporter
MPTNLKKLLNYIDKKVIKSAVRLHSATVLTKIIAGFLTTKFIAVYIGAEGLALIGNLRSFLSSAQAFGTVGVYNGLVKYISKYKNNALQLSKTLSTAYYIGFIATMLISLMCYYNADFINDFLFSDQYNYKYVIKIMAVALPFYSLNLFSFSIMNGFEKYKFLMIINIIGQIMGLSVTLLLIWQNNIDGALISVVIAPSLIFLITVVGILNRRNLLKEVKVSNVDYKWVKRLSPYAIMALVSGIAFPLVIIGVRNYIISVEGMQEAGFWEAMNRISSYYLLFVNSIMALYFLPRFSEIDTKKEFRNEVFDFYKTIIPIFAMGLLVIYLLRPFIVALFLTDEFQPVENLFIWQLLGDFVKVLALVIAYQFIAKKMFWHFIITEAFLLFMIYFTSVYFVDLYGVKGANIAHFASYGVYYIIILLIFGSSLFGIDSEEKNLLD